MNSAARCIKLSEAFIFKHVTICYQCTTHNSRFVSSLSYRENLRRFGRVASLGTMTDPVVTVQQGQLKGKTEEDLNGKIYYAFQGIPYGRPPVGDLRFKAPLPAESWTGIRDATEEGSESISKHMFFDTPIGSEDCLSLNVFTPQLPRANTSPKAVMVWIHGGGFVMGSSKTEMYGPQFLVKHDIILVSINYRLAVLGFLSLEDTSLGVPGNAGLKDMVLALKWVQNNISQFGGDPNNVTIFGESAGSVAVHFLILSPMAKGLFHRAILQSGVVLNPWAFGERSGIQLAKVLGKNECSNEKEALEFLRSVPAEKFHGAEDLLNDTLLLDKTRPFCPVIEKPNPEAFLTQDPLSLMLSGNYNQVPLIIGYTSREGMLLDYLQKKDNQAFDFRPKNFEREINRAYKIEKGSEESKRLAKKIEDFYYAKAKTPEDEVDCYYKMTSDTYFNRGIHVTLRALLKITTKPIYLYIFSLEGELNIIKKKGNITSPGASHGDDLAYLFHTIMTPKIDPSSAEDIAVHRMTTWWTNFAKRGDPNPSGQDPLINVQWPPLTLQAYNALEINRELSITKNPDKDEMQFWDNVADSLNSNL